MDTILILGAGLSTTTLISYLLEKSGNHWKIRVGDIQPERALEKIQGHPNGEAFRFDVDQMEQREQEIDAARLVISMLPARMHHLVAESCIHRGKNLVTASYMTSHMESLESEAKKRGVVLMNECGVDPGIDHMSAVQMIARIREEGGKILSFESSTGGLVAPGFENNPWQYKFTWNPRNVVLAGREGSRFLHNGKFKYIPYHKVFQRTEEIEVPGLGSFEVYGNRDSLTYRDAYGLSNLQTMFRGTIRRPGFCKAWDIFVQLGITDDSFLMEGSDTMTNREFINSFMAYQTDIPVETKLAKYLGFKEDSDMMERLRWLGIFENRVIGVPHLSPARVLQKILEDKWKLDPGDRDMIVMQHQFDFLKKEEHLKRYATMVYIGSDSRQTAMSVTVGLALGMVSRAILEGRFKKPGVHLPIYPEIYEPVMKELAEREVKFVEHEIKMTRKIPDRKGQNRT